MSAQSKLSTAKVGREWDWVHDKILQTRKIKRQSVRQLLPLVCWFSSDLFGFIQTTRWGRPPACRREDVGAGALPQWACASS
jgi:hypothetical protein